MLAGVLVSCEMHGYVIYPEIARLPSFTYGSLQIALHDHFGVSPRRSMVSTTPILVGSRLDRSAAEWIGLMYSCYMNYASIADV